jgi:hypothetical protein
MDTKKLYAIAYTTIVTNPITGQQRTKDNIQYMTGYSDYFAKQLAAQISESVGLDVDVYVVKELED